MNAKESEESIARSDNRFVGLWAPGGVRLPLGSQCTVVYLNLSGTVSENRTTIDQLDILVVYLPSSRTPGWRDPIEIALKVIPKVPTVLVVDFPLTQLAGLGPLPPCQLVTLPGDPTLAQVIKYTRRGDPGLLIESRLSQMLPGPRFPLTTAISVICQWKPTILLNPGSRPPPTVGSVCREIGVSSSLLYQRARRQGLNLRELISSILIIRAVQLHNNRGMSWSAILSLYGKSSTAWSQFVRYHWSMTPTDVARLSLEEWVLLALRKSLTDPNKQMSRFEKDLRISKTKRHK